MVNMVDQKGGSQNGPPNGVYTHTTQQPPTEQQPMTRPFTLQEALPYSPQTSVIPFTSDLIPDPILGSGLLASSVSSLFNNQDFENLNKEAAGQSQVPKPFKYAVDYILHDLKANQRTHYNFKPTARPVNSGASNSHFPSLTAGMSPLSKMVYDKAPTFIKLPTPDTPGSRSPNGPKTTQQRSQLVKKNQSPKTSKHVATNSEAHRQNAAKLEVVIPSQKFDPTAYVEVFEQSAPQPTVGNPLIEQRLPTPTGPPVTPVKSSLQPFGGTENPLFAIEIAPATGFNKDEYLAVPDSPDEPLNLSSRKRKRDREAYGDSQDVFAASLDQRQRAEAALQDLEQLIRDMFDAVGNVIGTIPGYSHIAGLTNDNEPVLTATSHQKLQAAIQKVIGLGCYSQVSLDDLLRIQKLSEATLKHTQSLDIRLDESWSESDIQAWLEQIPEIETGLKAARTSLRIMCGGREEKQLYSEETIQQCVDLFKNVVDGIAVSVVELRNSGQSATLFKAIQPQKKAIASILTNCQRLFALLTTLVTSIELSETAVNTLEFTASRLIFVENAYYEKDSVIGVQKFDGIRLVAMDMLCQIFLMKPEQRQGIFDDILTSLEKLPVGKQSARQFRLSDGGSIQPVSALIMRLVQASSGRIDQRERHRGAVVKSLEDDVDAEGEEDGVAPDSGVTKVVSTIQSEEDGASQHGTAIDDLKNMAAPLAATTIRNASYVVNFMVNRALKSTKSGDTPYRNLLDLFVEDFTTCLDSPDWPAAELILRQMTSYMVKLWEGEKSAAPAKNMALELLGTMGAAISKLRSHVRKTATALDGGSDELTRFLSDLANSALEQRSRAEHIIGWSGPYRATLEYLEERCADDPHLQSAISFLIADWAQRVTLTYDALEEDLEDRDREFGRLGYRLRRMIEDRRWLSTEYTFKTVSSSHAKLSYDIILLRSQFCEAFSGMLNILLSAMASDQATVRSKSLKSINQVLETDPAILDGDSIVIQLILQCSNDSSPQVRDSALGLIGKCIGMRPNLETKMAPTIIDRFVDSGVGVRKRAMKLARDIYLRNRSKEARSAIANGLLHRVQDPDEGVRELARQMIEEVWFAPFYQADDTAAFKISLTDHVTLMIQTVKSGNVTGILDKVLQSILGSQNKGHEGPFGVSAKLVENMFELIDNLDSDDPSIPSGRDALQVLMIFAKADAKLFTFEEIRLLKPHLASIGSNDDLAVFKAVVVIYRQVLPQLSSMHSDFLKEVRDQLQRSVAKIGKQLLDDVVACLWIIATLLNNREPLARLSSSSLRQTAGLRQGVMDKKKLATFARYSVIVGMVGKHCDLDGEIDIFKAIFTKWQGTSVAKLMVDTLSPWAAPSQPLEARKSALDAIGLVCQAWPRNYVSPNVYTNFQQVFEERIPALEHTILRSFKEFLLAEEKRSEAASAAPAIGGEGDKKRELTVMGGTNYDDVASATTQRFLKQITRISLSSQDEHAFLAVEVLGSINRQGLVHPKETGVTLITLETSSLPRISELAYMEHRALHEKHETVLEREYIKAIQAAFEYQRDIVKESHGATTNPFQSKLHLLMEVLKVSKSKNRQKFLEKLVVQVDLDPAKLDVSAAMPPHVEFSRFIIENVAFFDYMTVGEVLATVNAMEKLVSSTGSSLAHLIESELFNVRMDVEQANEAQPDGQPVALQLSVDPVRLRQVTAASIVLMSLWEARTYIRRLYGMGSNRRESKGKGAAKDLNKTPIKVQGVSGDKFWEEITSNMAGLQSQHAMLQKCKAFVELMNVDKEFKVTDEDAEMNGDGPSTPSEGEEDGPLNDRGRKRKAGTTPGGRKKRARSTSRARGRGRPRKQSIHEEDAEGDLDDTVDWF